MDVEGPQARGRVVASERVAVDRLSVGLEDRLGRARRVSVRLGVPARRGLAAQRERVDADVVRADGIVGLDVKETLEPCAVDDTTSVRVERERAGGVDLSLRR